MFILAMQRMKLELLTGFPPHFWTKCHESGWMQRQISASFIKLIYASNDNYFLLLLDGKALHTKNTELSVSCFFVCVCEDCPSRCCVWQWGSPSYLQPNCTHRLQPLGMAFKEPVSAVTTWIRSPPGRNVTSFQIGELHGSAFIWSVVLINGTDIIRKNWYFDHCIKLFSQAITFSIQKQRILWLIPKICERL